MLSINREDCSESSGAASTVSINACTAWRRAPPAGSSTGHDSTAAEVIDGVDLSGKRAIVTGSASGIGIETARARASAGAEVTLAVRNPEAGATVAAEITASTGNTAVTVAALELTDPDSVAALVGGWRGPLHILVNNAGIMALPELTRTAEGWEIQFATNHLGHFALALGLHDALAAANGARIVSVSSGGIKTGLDRHQTSPEFLEAARNYPYKTIEQGAATSILLAASPLLDGVTGHYFEDSNEAALTDDPAAQEGVRAYALDPAAATRLWDASVELLAQR